MWIMYARKLAAVVNLKLAIGYSGDVFAAPNVPLTCLLFLIFSFSLG